MSGELLLLDLLLLEMISPCSWRVCTCYFVEHYHPHIVLISYHPIIPVPIQVLPLFFKGNLGYCSFESKTHKNINTLSGSSPLQHHDVYTMWAEAGHTFRTLNGEGKIEPVH